MKISLIGDHKIIMENPHSRHNYFAWPTVTRLQNGKLAVAASGYRLAHLCAFGKTVISYSENEGNTWTPPTPVIDTVIDDRDGGILPFGENSFILTSVNCDFAAIKMWNEKYGDIMNAKEYIDGYLATSNEKDEENYAGSTFRITHDGGVTFGPIYKAPITSPHGPCELPDGTILWVGRMIDEEAAKEDPKCIKAYKINLDGTSEYVGAIDNIISEDGEEMASYEPYAFALSDGTILCHIRVEPLTKSPDKIGAFTTYQSVSKDGGKTWSKPEAIIPIRGGAPAHIMQHSSGVLIATCGHRDAPFGVKAMFSKDNGKTWDYGYDIFTKGPNFDVGYPSTVELSDGSLLTVFYSRIEKNSHAVIMQQRWKFEE